MKCAFLVIAAMAVLGCDRYVENWELDRLGPACEGHGGVDRVWVDAGFDFPLVVYCNDGFRADTGAK